MNPAFLPEDGAKMELVERLRTISATAPFNCWAGIEVVSAAKGKVSLSMPWRSDFAQYSGFLHAGMIGALIDTACGFAAATLAQGILASHYSVDCLAPAVGEMFIAEGRVIKSGRRQIFSAADLFALDSGRRKLVATGSAILVPTVV